MQSLPNVLLYLAALLTFCAALLHFVCVFWGANGFRFLGAGKSIVQMVERGHWYPNFTAISVGLILTVCATYAFFAAKGIQILPFTKIILSLVAAVFLIRGFAFPWLKSKFVGNSDLFWYVSSAFCLILGALYAAGVYLI
ncbi:hypothetical protein [Acinetobacter pittii]|uniref:hypothetical protein n=1 Tax=Acinetobacter pittii TaxID=48296 RepID=UPI001023673C|nr:hypothetical protein [Acinetobacter pittii]MCG5264687.1 hypothetical protein [Acinetobacter pittii]MEC6392014.1 hypothetical protein [Acinetobacter pittii]RZG83743.1 hypothetical protein EXE06_06205 [Acinetobacter pittii]RZH56710.1 hypothetical protein EXD88_05160 [Acinetobacter pittii]RZH60863.1 hypothetical protein EXD90_06195 [Acinetobacter pittii]